MNRVTACGCGRIKENSFWRDTEPKRDYPAIGQFGVKFEQCDRCSGRKSDSAESAPKK